MDERLQLLEGWNDTARPYPRESSVPELFRAQAARTPDSISVSYGADELTYAALDERSERLANHLRQQGIARGDLVAICVERGVDLIVAMLGVLKAGAAYVPLDPAHPGSRLALMLEDSHARALLTHAAVRDELPEVSCPTISLDREWPTIAAACGGGPPVVMSAEDLAYVIYTSGSTGRPKGVCVPHRAIVRLVLGTDFVQLDADDRVAQVANASFDAATFEIWGGLLTGARIVGLDTDTTLAPSRFAEAIRAHDITVMFITTALFNQLETEVPGIFGSLHCLLFGGEAVDPARVRSVLESGPPGRLLHVYGPTENTTFSTWHEVESVSTDARTVSIGRPIANSTMYVLDPQGRPVPIGASGELYLGGDGLAVGYLSDPELTASRFVSHPFVTGERLYRTGDLVRLRDDGSIDFVGRIDHQVKLRGFRIELGEIETALLGTPEVRDAIVLCREDEPGDKRLVAYVVAAGEQAIERDDLRARLRETLPEYMVPSAIVELDTMPLNVNGKVDRRALPAPGRQVETKYLAARDDLERALVRMWEEVLGIEGMGVLDPFLDLGGDSLRAARVAGRIQEALGETVYASALFEAPTVASLAAYLTENYEEAASRICGGEWQPAKDGARGAAVEEPEIGEPQLAHLRSIIEPLAPRAGKPRKKNSRAVFILAPPRSGSTLFRIMLAGHPALFSPPELDLMSFNTLGERKAKCVGPYQFILEGVIRTLVELEECEAEEARRIMAGFEGRDLPVPDLYRYIQGRIGGRTLVEKTTIYGHDPETLKRIEEDFDHPLYVHLVRHPCGMIRSVQEARFDRIFRFENPYSPRQLGELLWTINHQNILAFLDNVPADRQYRVGFEDLVKDSGPVLERLCRFLGIDFDGDMVDPYRHQERRMTDGLYRESRVIGDYKFAQHKKVDAGVADRWKGTVRPETLGDPTRRLARSLGYADVPPPAEEATELSPIVTVPRGADLPVSFAQRRLWFLDRLGAGAAYNVGYSVRLHGRLDEDALQRSLDGVVGRHESLRTSFPAAHGEPLQRIAPAKPVPLRRVNLGHLGASEREDEAQRLVDAERGAPFDLAAGPLIRCSLIRLAADSHVLVLMIHHIVIDGWSVEILKRELAAHYAAYAAGAEPSLPVLPVQYADYAQWQDDWLRGEVASDLLEFWRGQLGTMPEVLDLPTDRPRPAVMTYEGAAHEFALSRELTTSLEAFARKHDVSMAMLLLAAFQTLLVRYTGQSDVVVGSPVANRKRREVEALIGFFANSLVLRTDLSGDPSFTDALRRVKGVSLAAYDHQDLPFEQLVKTLVQERDVSINPIFQVLFALHRAWEEELELPGLQVEPFARCRATAHVDLELQVVEGAVLAGEFIYNTNLFDPATIERLAAHFEELLRAIVADPERRISELPILCDAERRQQLVDWNATERTYPEPRLLHELVAHQVALTPDAVAVEFEAETLTYADLDRRSNQLAHLLLRHGVGPDVPVGVCLERSTEMVVGLLGILKAGGAYVPLDPEYPESRLSFMLEEARTPVVLTQARLRSVLPAAQLVDAGSVVLCLDESSDDVFSGATEPPQVDVGPDHLAYVIYTSGSTGRPKGAMNPHLAIVNRLQWMQEAYGLDADDRVLQKTPFSFDVSVWEIFWPLITGARLVMAQPDGHRDPAYLARTIAGRGITTLHFVPSMLRAFLEAPGLRAGVGLKRVICSGEALAPDLRDGFVERFDAQLHNLYGPTEAAVDVTATRCDDAPKGAPVSIGRPIANTTAYVLDQNMEPAPLGVAGELYIGGVQVARGYLGRPGLTAERFVPDPYGGPGARLYRTGDRVRFLPGGDIGFLGRLDHQVKLRGLRIELGEIEAALTAFAEVTSAAVDCREDLPGQARLVAYVVGDGASEDELRRRLAETLPEYMVPSGFVFLGELPTTASGKVDRRALPAPSTERRAEGEYVAPQGGAETAVVAIWRDLLGLDKVGVHENFFELGGDSLLLARLQARLIEQTAREISLVDLFRHPTVATMARLVRDGRETGHGYLAAAREERAKSGGGASEGTAVAIIGMAGRFPGAGDVDEFWSNLRSGVESIAFFDEAELRRGGVAEGDIRNPDYVPAKGVLADADGFDAGFFDYAPREAEVIDPQHRVLLECAWTALESAGYDAGAYPGRIGIYAGSSPNTYVRGLRANPAFMAAADPMKLRLGNEMDYAATRVAYKMNLRGPAVTVQTACSTSLVAVHQARNSLLAGECTMALAGGVRVSAPLASGYVHAEGGIRSRDGHCRTFDADASGTVGGDGVGVVVLKRLADAMADGDRIHAVILGSAVNNDGAMKVGFTAPSVDGQAEAIADALCAANVDPATIGYVEAHGTATELGDPVEVAVLSQVYAESADRRQYCAIGSLKSNVGHLDAAAGVGGLMKATLAVEHGEIPPTLHYRAPNPQIDFERSPFFVNTTLRKWTSPDHPRRAGVSSLGIGGTNAHVVLEAAPSSPESDPARLWQVLTLSARTASALEQMTNDLRERLERQPEINLADVAYTLQVGRRDFEHRRTVVVEDTADATRVLRERDRRRVFDGIVGGMERPVVFMFPGQGAQHPDMARGMYETRAVFRAEVDRCCAELEGSLGLDLRSLLFPEAAEADTAAQRLERTALAQPALFTIEYALARQWIAWGVEPAAMIGHSIGEYVAACLSGVMGLEDALALVAERGRLMDGMPGGSMLAVPLPVEALRGSLHGELAIATTNGPELCVVSGPDADIGALEEELRGRGVEPQRLHTSHAFHSAMMEPIVEPFRRRVASVALQPPQLPYVSNVTGTWITESEATDPDYYARHLRQEVRFSEGLETLFEASDRVLLEVGPGRTLAALARRHPGRPDSHPAVSSLPRPKEDLPDEATIAEALGQVWVCGGRVRWADVHAEERRHRIALPTYPFERRRYWIDGQGEPETVGAPRRKVEADHWIYAPSWQRTTVPGAPDGPVGRRFLLFVDPALGTVLAATLKSRGCDVTCVEIGDRYERSGSHFSIDPADAGHFARLVGDLEAEGQRPDGIVHLWPLGAEGPSAGRGLDLSLYSVVRLMQALDGDVQASGELVLVTKEAHEVIGTEAVSPLQAASMGSAKVIPLEFPGIRCRCVDLEDSLDGAETGRRADELAAELLAPLDEGVVAYRSGHRWVQRFAPVPAAAATESCIRQRGVYLITGGLGGVGLVTAGWLARRYAARLVLVGRSSLPARDGWDDWLAEHGEADATSVRIGLVRLLEAAGAEVMMACADATDATALGRVLEEVDARFGPVNGVFHAAGETDVRTPMCDFDQASWERVFEAKRQGVHALEQALEGRSLDFCVVHSSLASVMGALELGAYAAAHLYMDAFVWARRRTSALPWRTINWDAWRTWRNASQAIPPGLAEYIMDGADAAEALHRVFVHGDVPQLLVSTGDLEARIEQWRGPSHTLEQGADSSAQLHPRASSLSTEYEAPRTEDEQTLAGIWERLLGIQPIGIHDDFFELGGDSVLNLQIVAKAKQEGVSITPRAVFDHPTIATLASTAKADVAREGSKAPCETAGNGRPGEAGEASPGATGGFTAASLSADDLAAIARQLGRDSDAG